MRKIVVFNQVSVDGFFAGPNGENNWVMHEPAVGAAAHEMLNPDTVLFGRITYQMFENYWPKVGKDANAPKEEQDIADELNQITKVVFSTTLKEVTWQNSVVIKGDLIKEVKKLKQGEGADLIIFGSGTIVQQLATEGLIDEYLLAVNPIVLGAGKSFFTNVGKVNLEHLETRNFESGHVMIHYRTGK